MKRIACMPFASDSSTKQMFLASLRLQAPLGFARRCLTPKLRNLLQRMFRDPRVLKPARARRLDRAAAKMPSNSTPHVPEIACCYGMALCVDLQAQEAHGADARSARQAPDCFIARLKFGELLMRLRICDQAAEADTEGGASLRQTHVQSELARKQAATIRTMLGKESSAEAIAGLLCRLTPLAPQIQATRTPQPVLASSK